MKQIQDKMLIEELVDRYHIRSFFETANLVFLAFSWQKGELLCSPLNPAEHLLFLVQGSVNMYDLREDGTTSPVTVLSGFSLVGDMEFITSGLTRYYLEAAEDCLCVALPLAPYREQLDRDVTFLHCLLDILADKFAASSEDTVSAGDLEERLLTWLREEAPEHRLHGLESAMCQLRCSRRQLQRVLSSLCSQGSLVHTGKGQYELSKEQLRSA